MMLKYKISTPHFDFIANITFLMQATINISYSIQMTLHHCPFVYVIFDFDKSLSK